MSDSEPIEISRSAAYVEHAPDPAKPDQTYRYATPSEHTEVRANRTTIVATNTALAAKSRNSAKPYVAFDRRELDTVLRLYGRMVALGEWRDYAISHLSEKAVFSVFRRSTEFPLYSIVKTPKLAKRQGAYSVVTPSGQILKRGHELAQVLKVLEKRRLQVVG